MPRPDICVIIPGEPHAQGRQRVRVLRTKTGRTIAHQYQPAESRNWKATAQAHMRRAMGKRSPFAGPVSVRIRAAFTCPRSDWRKQPRPWRYHAKRPDIDNCLKAIFDAATGVLWFDDSQVAELHATKSIAAQGVAPSVEIEVTELA